MKYGYLFLFAFALCACSSQQGMKDLRGENPASDPAPVQVHTPAVDTDSAASELTDDLIAQLLERARQHYTAALEAEEAGDSLASSAEFEQAINILNELGDQPGIDANQEFNDLTSSVVEDYEKYISSIDVLGPAASVFALREKMSQIIDSGPTGISDEITDVIASSAIPLPVNGYVERAILYFRTKGKEHFEIYLSRAEKYFPMIRSILKEEHLPEELVYLSMVESGVNPLARSWARAVGIWQFIKGTGYLYGLRGNWWHDERRDVEKSTRAAARHLRDLYNEFDDWHLALAAYNSGAGRVYRAIRRSRSTDFWELRRYLPRETRNYVPLFIASAIMSMKPTEFGFTVTPGEPLQYEDVLISECVDLEILAECAETDVQTLRGLNPELLQWSTPPGIKDFRLHIPPGKRAVFADNYSKVPDEKKRNWMVHVVRKGEVPGKIARKYGISTELLLETNRLTSSRSLSIGRNLLIPVPATAMRGRSALTPAVADAGSGRRVAPERRRERLMAQSTRGKSKSVHVVKAGDTLGQIAEQYGVRTAHLRIWNDISYRSTIFPGETLAVWIDPRVSLAARQKPQDNGTAPAGWQRYTIREGDTLEEIAQAHSVLVQDIRRWNGLLTSLIRVGQELLIEVDEKQPNNNGHLTAAKPDPSRRYILYRIRRGDSLSRIADTFGISVLELKTWNNLRTDMIRRGQQLIIYSDNVPPPLSKTG